LLLLALIILPCRDSLKAEDQPSDSITVTSEGTADIRGAGVSEAVDRAYLDAQKKAVESALGKMYSATTVVEAGRFIEQNVMSDISGYIRNWEKVDGPDTRTFSGTDEKVVWVKIRAEIGLGKLKSDTLSLEKIQQRLGRPDMAVIIDNIHASQAASKKLEENRITVKKLRVPEGMDRFEYAAENGVDILIEGDAETTDAGSVMDGVKLKSYQSDVQLKAVNVIDGEIIAQASAHGAAAHIQDEPGRAEAVRKASEKAAEELTSHLLEAWQDVLNNGNIIYLEVKNVPFKKETEFRKKLGSGFRGIREIHPKGFRNEKHIYKLKYLGDARMLASDLDTYNKDGFNLKVTGYRLNRVEAEMEQ